MDKWCDDAMPVLWIEPFVLAMLKSFDHEFGLQEIYKCSPFFVYF